VFLGSGNTSVWKTSFHIILGFPLSSTNSDMIPKHRVSNTSSLCGTLDFNSLQLKPHIRGQDISFPNWKIQIITKFDNYYFGSLLKWCFNPLTEVHKTNDPVWNDNSSVNNELMIIAQFPNSFHVWKWHAKT
jgi:hypothetical protein